MSTDTPTPSPAPEPEPEPEAKKRKPKGIVSQEIHHEITVAEDCFRLTDEDEAILSALTDRAWAGKALLGASVTRCHQLVADITGKRSTRSSRTAA